MNMDSPLSTSTTLTPSIPVKEAQPSSGTQAPPAPAATDQATCFHALEALPPKQAGESDPAHFVQPPLYVDTAPKRLEQLTRLASLAQPGRVEIPRETQEAHATHALTATMDYIDGIADRLLHKLDAAEASGDKNRIAALEQDIHEFVADAERTMSELGASIIREQLSQAPSAELTKVLNYMTKGIWDDLRHMQEQIQQIVSSPPDLSDKPGENEMGWEARVALIAQQTLARLQNTLQGFLQGKIRRSSFDPATLPGVRRLLMRLAEGNTPGRNPFPTAFPGPFAGQGNAPFASPFTSPLTSQFSSQFSSQFANPFSSAGLDDDDGTEEDTQD